MGTNRFLRLSPTAAIRCCALFAWFLFCEAGWTLDSKPTGLRLWKDAQGRMVEASLRGVDGGDVILSLKDGRVARLPLIKLGDEDKLFVLTSASSLITVSDPSGAALASSPAAPAPLRVIHGAWPKRVTVPLNVTRVRKMEPPAGETGSIYETSSFQIKSDAPLNLQAASAVALIFESAREMLRLSPWGLRALPPGGKFKAELFATEAAYHKRGAPYSTSGVYFRADRVFCVPFSSLGLSSNNGVWVKNEQFEIKTLMHELTHMMMHDLLNSMPMWASEGTAEYIECVPFKNGVFECDKITDSIKKHQKEFGVGFTPFEEVLHLTTEKFQGSMGVRSKDGFIPIEVSPSSNQKVAQNYASSLLLVYYFSHLDGDRRGTRFLNFLEACGRDRPKWDTYEAGFARYKAEIAEFMKKPGVQDLGNGRFSFPQTLTPPREPKLPYEVEEDKIPFVHMDILLAGRTIEQVAEDARQALRKAGL